MAPHLLVRLIGTASCVAACAGSPTRPSPESPQRPPNIIVILADDLGYGDLGAYGQTKILTPRLDRMAAEGMRFTQFYAGSTVCAPSRSVLMTGKHTGHTSVRGNARGDRQFLRSEDVTIAEVLKSANYATALVGKWGLGDDGNAGRPDRQGFDSYYGFLNQVHAHNHFPQWLWRNQHKEPLRNVVKDVGPEDAEFRGGYATKKVDWAQDRFMEEALTFIRAHAAQPFFLYLALTLPHANNEATAALGNGQEVPDLAPYDGEAWPEAAKGQAAMITRMDRDVGRVLDLLRKMAIAERTLVLFTSDNGPHSEGGFDASLFKPAGGLRGQKRDLYEGGIRVPMIAWWPSQVSAGATSDHVAYNGDIMATVAELAGVSAPAGLDSRSLVPALRGAASGPARPLYWEFYEQGGKQAAREGRWKAIRSPAAFSNRPVGTVELYDLDADRSETQDVSRRFPEVVTRMTALMDEAHVPDPRWRVGN